jgi:hypothetical protein
MGKNSLLLLKLIFVHIFLLIWYRKSLIIKIITKIGDCLRPSTDIVPQSGTKSVSLSIWQVTRFLALLLKTTYNKSQSVQNLMNVR